MTTPLLDERRLKAAVDDWARQSARRLSERRRALGLTQHDLADLVGVRPTSISKFELGQAVPKDLVRLAIAFALACEVTDIWPALQREYVAIAARAA